MTTLKKRESGLALFVSKKSKMPLGCTVFVEYDSHCGSVVDSNTRCV
jgi:hypothetical protein